MKLPQLSVRDLFWLVLVVGMACAWGSTGGAGFSRQRPRSSCPNLRRPVPQAPVDASQGSRSFTNTLGMSLIPIPAGTLCPLARQPQDESGTPLSMIGIAHPFYIGAHEVTVRQFREFVERTGYKTSAECDRTGGFAFSSEGGGEWSTKVSWRNPGFAQADRQPVCNVSWIDAQAFCAWLSKRESRRYRLPTEVEWEYACYGLPTPATDAPAGQSGNVADKSFARNYSWYPALPHDDRFSFTAPAGSYPANAFGLYDMIGNVWEWCGETYDEDGRPNSQPFRRDLPQPSSWIHDPNERRHALKGTSWFCEPAGDPRTATNRLWADDRDFDIGFRVVLEVEPSP